MRDTRRLAAETRTGPDAPLSLLTGSRIRQRIRATHPPGAVALVSAALVLTALVLTVQSVLVSFATHGALPQGDEWFNLAVFRSILTGKTVLADLFGQHNDHRIAFPRLILFSDYLFFKGEGNFDLTAIFLMQGTLVGLLLSLLAGTQTIGKGSVAVGAMVPLLLFSLRQSENFVWGFQVTFISVFTLAALAIVIFARALERSRLAGRSGVLTLVSCGFAALATFAMSNGLLCAVVLILMAMVARASRRQIIGMAAVTAALIAAFSFRYHLLGGAPLREAWMRDPVAVLLYAAAYIGNFLDPDIDAAIFFGACGLMALVIVFARFVTGRDRDPTRLALLGIALFTAGSAFVTALGRFSDGIGGAMSSRYATGSALFWCAMLICGWSLSGSSSRSVAVALRIILAGACLVLLTAIVQVQAPGVAILQDRAFNRNMIENALDQGLVDEPMLTSMDEFPVQVREILPLLRSRDISIFAGQDAHVFGRPLDEAGRVDAHPCPGSFDSAESAPALGANGVRVNGTSGLHHVVPTSARVYLVDPRGMVVGFASTPYGQPGWSGYATAARNERLRAFARLGSGRLCDVGTAAVAEERKPEAALSTP